MCWRVVFQNSRRSCLTQSGVSGVSYGIWRWEQCNGGMSGPLLGVRQLPYSKLVPHMKQELTTARFRHVSFIHHKRRPVCRIRMFPLPQSALSAFALSFHRQLMLFLRLGPQEHAMLGEIRQKSSIGVSFVRKPAHNTHVFDVVRAEAVGCRSSIYGLRAVFTRWTRAHSSLLLHIHVFINYTCTKGKPPSWRPAATLSSIDPSTLLSLQYNTNNPSIS